MFCKNPFKTSFSYSKNWLLMLLRRGSITHKFWFIIFCYWFEGEGSNEPTNTMILFSDIVVHHVDHLLQLITVLIVWYSLIKPNSHMIRDLEVLLQPYIFLIQSITKDRKSHSLFFFLFDLTYVAHLGSSIWCTSGNDAKYMLCILSEFIWKSNDFPDNALNVILH